jgi:hypothetical protein
VNSSSNDRAPEVTALGLLLYFASDRPESYGSRDIWNSFWGGDGWSEAMHITEKDDGRADGPTDREAGQVRLEL